MDIYKKNEENVEKWEKLVSMIEELEEDKRATVSVEGFEFSRYISSIFKKTLGATIEGGVITLRFTSNYVHLITPITAFQDKYLPLINEVFELELKSSSWAFNY